MSNRVISRLGRRLGVHESWWWSPIAALDPVAHCLELSRAHRERHALAEADVIVEKARSEHPGHVGLAIEHAEIATARKDWANAAARWRMVLDLLGDAAPAEAYAMLGQALRKKRDFAAADTVLEIGRSRFPQDLAIAVAYGRTAMDGKDWPEAAARWSGILRAFGDAAPAEVGTSLGKAYRRQGTFDAAEAAIQEARAKHAGDINVAAESAEIAMARQDWPEAITRWQTVLDRFPQQITQDMQLRISLAHRLHGDFAGARRMLETLRSSKQEIALRGYGPIAQIIDRQTPRVAATLRDSVCVQLHLYYVNTFPMYVAALDFIPRPYALFVSVPERENPEMWRDRFSAALPGVAEISVKPVKNRGRDVMPWLCTFRDDILQHDLMLHIHTKASPQSFGLLWHDFLLHHVCGSPAVAGSILRLFADDERLGLVFPPYYDLKGNQPDWGANYDACRKLYAAMTGEAPPVRCPDFPVGSFFWARTRYLAPLYALNITQADFPDEMSQSDGTLAHSIERVVGMLDKPSGMTKQCISVHPPLSLDDVIALGNA